MKSSDPYVLLVVVFGGLCLGLVLYVLFGLPVHGKLVKITGSAGVVEISYDNSRVQVEVENDIYDYNVGDSVVVRKPNYLVGSKLIKKLPPSELTEAKTVLKHAAVLLDQENADSAKIIIEEYLLKH